MGGSAGNSGTQHNNSPRVGVGAPPRRAPRAEMSDSVPRRLGPGPVHSAGPSPPSAHTTAVTAAWLWLVGPFEK